MSCPYFENRRTRAKGSWPVNSENLTEDYEQKGVNRVKDEGQMSYGQYLKLDKILNAQVSPSSYLTQATMIHEEHLFIITHQTFELWFKQILFEIDSIREIFSSEYLEERKQLTVISRLNRIVEIFKILCSQFLVLETMTPQDFLDMRQVLGNSSGFQSFQFRMLEIRLGLREDLRVLYNKKHFMEVFFGKERESLENAGKESSLFTVVNDWLERTPGLDQSGFNFFSKYEECVLRMIQEEENEAEECEDEEERRFLLESTQKRREMFNSLLDKQLHDDLVRKGARRFSHKAMQGALMICMYRDEPRCHLPFQLLQCLMDIDSQLTKFRYNHTCMVQRMIGGKAGTGGSSGYFYLRSTCSDRYKVFIDLLNMPSFLVTRDRIPPLTLGIKRSLSIHDWIDADILNKPPSESDADSGIISSLTKGIRYLSSSPGKSLEIRTKDEQI